MPVAPNWLAFNRDPLRRCRQCCLMTRLIWIIACLVWLLVPLAHGGPKIRKSVGKPRGSARPQGTAQGSEEDAAPLEGTEDSELLDMANASDALAVAHSVEGATWYWSEGQPTWSPNVVPLEVLREPSQALCGLFQSLENTVAWCPNELDDAVIRVALFLQGMLHDGLQPYQLMAAIDEALSQLGGNQAYQGLCRMLGDKATQVLQEWGFLCQSPGNTMTIGEAPLADLEIALQALRSHEEAVRRGDAEAGHGCSTSASSNGPLERVEAAVARIRQHHNAQGQPLTTPPCRTLPPVQQDDDGPDNTDDCRQSLQVAPSRSTAVGSPRRPTTQTQ